MSAMKAGFQIAECSLSSAITIQNNFFKKLIGVTTCKIVRDAVMVIYLPVKIKI